jgi:hypothetical protein
MPASQSPHLGVERGGADFIPSRGRGDTVMNGIPPGWPPPAV